MLAAVALMVTVIALAEVFTLRSYLLGREVNRLQQAAQTGVNPPPQAPPGSPGAGGPQARQDPAQIVDRLARSGIAAEVIDGSGNVLASAAGPTSDQSSSFSVPSGISTSTSGTETTADGLHLMLLSAALPQPPGASLIVATDLSQDDATIQALLWIVIASGGATLVLALLIAIPLVRGALRPLRRMSGAANAMANGDLTQRVGLSSNRDEIGELGHAFDEMADRIQSLVEELQDRERTVRQFVEDASHELRTPVTAIRGSSQVLQRGDLGDDDVHEALQNITLESTRLSHLLEELLELSRIDGRPGGKTGETTNLGSLFDANSARWQQLAGEHELKLDAAQLVVRAPNSDLVRLIDNLISNSAKYSGGDSPIEVSVRHDTGRSLAVIEVRDHGPGIPEADLEQVFARFYRGSNARSRSISGTGLGLAIVRAIAEQHGGRVEAENATDGGAFIRVRFPLAAA
jgi:two-component system OmpR family sensor kinase